METSVNQSNNLRPIAPNSLIRASFPSAESPSSDVFSFRMSIPVKL